MDTLELGLDAPEREDSRERVECLGRIFESDQARREHYLALLAEKLKDPEFRNTPGFPRGTDEAILRMSDPPHYTACPNPFLEDFVQQYGRPYDPTEDYHQEPFAVDVSVGKMDPLYKAHGYHTKVPHLAIVPSILHYTKPGDIVLDGFCGSGMTGVAGQWCATAPIKYRKKLEAEWKSDGREPPKWGMRRVILGDIGPAATFISANYSIPFDVDRFTKVADRILTEVESELGWMYETRHVDGSTDGQINYTVWSEVLSCPECSRNLVFLNEALDKNTGQVCSQFQCSGCGSNISKRRLIRFLETLIDPVIGTPWSRIKLVPVSIHYTLNGTEYEKVLDSKDHAKLDDIGQLEIPAIAPTNPFPINKMYHGSRLAPKGFTHAHRLFLNRPLQSLAALWEKASSIQDIRLRNMLLYLVEQSIWNFSLLNAYRPTGYSQNSQWFKGIYYVPSQHSECSPWYILGNKRKRLSGVFSQYQMIEDCCTITTGDCARISAPNSSIDYVFTDPPFGENIFYGDLNFFVESWHRVFTNTRTEAIIDSVKKKTTADYQRKMHNCFREYHRLLKPGRWMTVVFSNSKNLIWRAIQEAIGTAGFVIADVRTLDKMQGSFRQVTSSAVKQDLVISAYKPTEGLEARFKLGEATIDDVWHFVREHLGNVPIFVSRSSVEADIVIERTPQMLHDRMIAFFVQRRVAVPISSSDFFMGLDQRYPKRDGMYFLPDQLSEYDRRRTTVRELKQLELFVQDEASATQWIRQQLQSKPQTFQDLQPQFMQQLQAWAKHEKTVELKEILDLNFLCYDGEGSVPSQIHSYLSTNFKLLRNRDKDDRMLRAKAIDRWYVPDPRKDGDLQKLRMRAMLREFDQYRVSTQHRIRQFRTEAVRAGFKHCYDTQDYRTIVDVARKLPEQVVQEDERLLMYYDVATMRLGDPGED